MARKKTAVSVSPGETKQMTIPNGRAKHTILTDGQVLLIRDEFYRGIPARIIGMREKVSTTVIRECITRKTFKHHPGPEVKGSDFHSRNKRNIWAYNKAKSMYGDKPTSKQVEVIMIAADNARALNEESLKKPFCVYCVDRHATIPVKIIIEDKPKFDVSLCAICFGEFYNRVRGFFVG